MDDPYPSFHLAAHDETLKIRLLARNAYTHKLIQPSFCAISTLTGYIIQGKSTLTALDLRVDDVVEKSLQSLESQQNLINRTDLMGNMTLNFRPRLSCSLKPGTKMQISGQEKRGKRAQISVRGVEWARECGAI